MFGRRRNSGYPIEYQVSILSEAVNTIGHRVDEIESQSDSTDQLLRKRVRDLEEEVRFLKRIIQVVSGLGGLVLAKVVGDLLNLL